MKDFFRRLSDRGKKKQDSNLPVQHESLLDLPYTARNKPLRRYGWSGNIDTEYTSLDQLTIWRKHFWALSKPGDGKCWDTLFGCCSCLLDDATDGALPRAQWYLDEGGLNLPSGLLINGAYDKNGQKYEIPAYICENPVNMQPDNHLVTNDGPCPHWESDVYHGIFRETPSPSPRTRRNYESRSQVRARQHILTQSSPSLLLPQPSTTDPSTNTARLGHRPNVRFEIDEKFKSKDNTSPDVSTKGSAIMELERKKSINLVKHSPPRVMEDDRPIEEEYHTAEESPEATQVDIEEASLEQYQPQKGKQKANSPSKGEERNVAALVKDTFAKYRKGKVDPSETVGQQRHKVWKSAAELEKSQPPTIHRLTFRLNTGNVIVMDVDIDDSVHNIKMRVMYRAQLFTRDFTIQLGQSTRIFDDNTTLARNIDPDKNDVIDAIIRVKDTFNYPLNQGSPKIAQMKESTFQHETADGNETLATEIKSTTSTTTLAGPSQLTQSGTGTVRYTKYAKRDVGVVHVDSSSDQLRPSTSSSQSVSTTSTTQQYHEFEEDQLKRNIYTPTPPPKAGSSKGSGHPYFHSVNDDIKVIPKGSRELKPKASAENISTTTISDVAQDYDKEKDTTDEHKAEKHNDSTKNDDPPNTPRRSLYGLVEQTHALRSYMDLANEEQQQDVKDDDCDPSYNQKN